MRAAPPPQFRWTPVLDRVENLSEREYDVFTRLGEGADNRSISRELRVSERTVKLHVTHILRKLGLNSRLQIGLVAAEYALLDALTDWISRLM
jgi:two-component system nitrate/nitrite response regulator NarL